MYFNPTDVVEIQDAMGTIITNQQLRDTLTTQGFSNVRRFSWEISTHKLYHEILYKTIQY